MQLKKRIQILPVLVLLVLLPVCVAAQQSSYLVRSKQVNVTLNSRGQITNIATADGSINKALTAYTVIDGYAEKQLPVMVRKDQHGISFIHQLCNDSAHQSCTVKESFIPAANSIHWQLEITTPNKTPWSAPIKTVVKYPANSNSRFWTAWGIPQFDAANCDAAMLNELMPYQSGETEQWLDPLVPVPFSKQVLYYGAPPFDYQDVKAGFVPLQGNLFAIPFASVFEKNASSGLSVFLSPADDIINLLMTTETDGNIVFERLFNKISNERKLQFSLDIVLHQNEWRSALQWFVNRYPSYINPVNKSAATLGGTAAYSNFFDDFDSAKMKRMAFTVNWQASFDFPYMGMFLPPVKKNEAWTRLGGGKITIQQMDDYAKRMKQKGFYVLSYFNVTEFGSWFKYPQVLNTVTDSNVWWKDCSSYLYHQFPGAMLNVSNKVNITDALDNKTVHGGPWYSWKDAVATDCGDTAYQKFLLQQAQRHVKEIPNSFGICIDRLDWLRFFNQNADDHITWFDDKPARSLVTSWKSLMQQLGPLMHKAGKSILVNNHYKRIDLLQHADGILDEFTNAAAPLNLTAFLTLNKPALGWTPGKEVIDAAGGDNFFQKYLYLGVFPMCPFPGNDHALQPDSMVDRLYLDYGPLMNQLKEKQWVLKPGMITLKEGQAKLNIFKIKNGYAIPVVYGEGDAVTVIIQDAKLSKGNFSVYLPGRTHPVKPSLKRKGTAVEVSMPLVRGAAMLTVSL